MKKNILVLFQDWNDWFINDYKRFEFWFKNLDQAYSEKNNYHILVLGNHNKIINPEDNVRVEIVKSSPFTQFLSFYKFRMKIKSYLRKNNYDYIYIPFMYMGSFLPKTNVKKIGFLRDKTYKMVIAQGGIRRLGGYLFLFLDFISVKKLDIILHNGNSLGNYAKNLVTNAKIIYNPRDVADKEYYKNTITFSKLISLKKDKKKIILSISRLTKGKNLELGLKALKNLPVEYVYVIVGEGEDREYFLSLVKSLNLKNRVYFLDFVPHEKIWQFYKGADVFWLLSKTDFEGTPNVLQEAFFARVPCIVSKISAMKNIVNDYENGLILKTWSAKELAEKTEGLILDKEMYSSIQKKQEEKIKSILKENKKVREYFV